VALGRDSYDLITIAGIHIALNRKQQTVEAVEIPSQARGWQIKKAASDFGAAAVTAARLN
jgi:hypothetical protein